MQYENGKIKLLPALPKSLSSGSVSGIITKGNVKIDMAWESGRLTKLSLRTPTAQTVKLSFCDSGEELTVNLPEDEPVLIL